MNAYRIIRNGAVVAFCETKAEAKAFIREKRDDAAGNTTYPEDYGIDKIAVSGRAQLVSALRDAMGQGGTL